MLHKVCLVKKTNVSFDIDNPEEYRVYEAVQSQPHKQRSKYLLRLAYMGLVSAANESENDIKNAVNEILTLIKSGYSVNVIQVNEDPEEPVSSEENEIDSYGIDDALLADMLGW